MKYGFLLLFPALCWGSGPKLSEFDIPGEYDVVRTKICYLYGEEEKCTEEEANSVLRIENRSIDGKQAFCLNARSDDPTRIECFYDHEVETRTAGSVADIIKYRRGTLKHGSDGFSYELITHDQICYRSSGECRDRDKYVEKFELYRDGENYFFVTNVDAALGTARRELRMSKR